MLLMGGVDTGWTFYTPFSTAYANGYVTATAVAVFINGFSTIMTSLNFVVTIHRLRAPGMYWSRLPLFIWAVYIMILPAMGVVSELVTCFARKRIFGYTGMTYALLAIAVSGFLVWGHHMF